MMPETSGRWAKRVKCSQMEVLNCDFGAHSVKEMRLYFHVMLTFFSIYVNTY